MGDSNNWKFFDTSLMPIVTIEFDPDNAPTDETVHDFIRQFEDLFNQGVPFYLFADTTTLQTPPMSFVTHMLSFLKQMDHAIPTILRGCAIMMNSSVIKTIIELLFKVRPPKSEIFMGDNQADIMAWLGARIPNLNEETQRLEQIVALMNQHNYPCDRNRIPLLLTSSSNNPLPKSALYWLLPQNTEEQKRPTLHEVDQEIFNSVN